MHLLIKEPAAEPVQPTKTDPNILSNVKFKKYFTLGKEKYRKRDYEAALKFYQRAQEVSPKNEEIKFLIKKVKLKLRHFENKDNGSGTVDTSGSSSTLPSAPGTPTPSPTSTPTTPSTSLSRTALPVGGTSAQAEPASASSAPAAIPINDSEGGNITPVPKSKSLGLIDDDSKCISCEGLGKCYWCNGSGKCDRCDGTGRFNDKPCSICNGTGKCNSCTGSGSCPWCKGSGMRNARRLNLSS